MANILLLNLLIAVFNAIFMYAHTFSHEIWKFNRFGVVMEYEQKPALPPPLIIFSHIFLIIKWCRRRTRGSTSQWFTSQWVVGSLSSMFQCFRVSCSKSFE